MAKKELLLNPYFKPGKLYKYLGLTPGRGANNVLAYKDDIMMYVGEEKIYWQGECYIIGFFLTNKGGKVFFEFMKDSSIDRQPRNYFIEIS